MLSKEVKEAILNGAYGMTREGRKVKYLGETDDKCYPLSFITVPDKISHIKPYGGIDETQIDLCKECTCKFNSFLSNLDVCTTQG